MIKNLTEKELTSLIKTVFHIKSEDKSLIFLMDLPNDRVKDNDQWKDTRGIVYEWHKLIGDGRGLGLRTVGFYAYENVGMNNAELPEKIYKIEKPDGKLSRENLIKYGSSVPVSEVLKEADIVIAPTWLSCTAPLKILAKKYNFRGVTMPGFTREMIPALGLDYEKISKKVFEIKEKMDRAEGFSLTLETGGKTYQSYFDLRFRTAHASTGLIREPMTVGNLPSGEAYIVPYEGEQDNEISETRGMLPVQFGDEIVVYKIEKNRAIEVIGDGDAAKKERDFLAREPAYGNISEVGIGILGEFGVKACGSILLDEKLGIHIAFGRSEHFGGIVGPSSFKDPKNVVHIDRVYVKSVQPQISVKESKFVYENGSREDFKAGA